MIAATASTYVGYLCTDQYQAIDLLSTFVAATNKCTELLKESYVLVNPIHFHKQAFGVDPQLGVVLMPFRPKWSNDVYRVFEAVLARKGFRCWRADVDKRDDAVM